MGQAWLSEHCAGSGPYDVSGWQRGQKLTLERVRNGARAFFTRVVFKVVPDESSRRLQLARGDVDFIDSVGAAAAPHYAALDGVTLKSLETHNVPSPT